MKIYITLDNKRNVKKNYPDLINKECAIIDIPSIYKSFNIDSVDGVSIRFLLSNSIISKLRLYYKNIKYTSLLYILSEDLTKNGIDMGFVSNFKNFVEASGIFFTEYILIDCDDQIDHKVYKYFSRVI